MDKCELVWVSVGQCGHVPLFVHELSLVAAIDCDIRLQSLQLFSELTPMTPESFQTLKMKAASLASYSETPDIVTFQMLGILSF